MSNTDDFIFLSPIPYPIEYHSQMDVTNIETLTPEECVEFFWRLKGVTISVSASVYAKNQKETYPIWNENKSTTLNTRNFDCASSLSMPQRILSSSQTFCFASNNSARFQITGPFLAEEYPEENNFAQRNYNYSFDFQFGVGCIEISSQFITPRPTSNGDNFYTVQRFPFEVFNKTFYLNLNVPHSIAHPEQYELEANYSGNAEVSFEFL